VFEKKEQINDAHILAHTKWNCKYHIVFAPKYRRKVFYNEKKDAVREIIRTLCQRYGNMKFAYRNREFWCKGYYVDTVGKNTKAIKEYIANQLKQDYEEDQISICDPRDPFTGSK